MRLASKRLDSLAKEKRDKLKSRFNKINSLRRGGYSFSVTFSSF